MTHCDSWKGKPLYGRKGRVDYPCLQGKASDATPSKEKKPTFPLYYGLYLDPERSHQEETAFLSDLLRVETVLQNIDWCLISTKKQRDDTWKETTGKWAPYFTLEVTKNSFHLQKNTEAIQEASQHFGVMILLSSTPKDVYTLLEQYKQREEVEKLFDAGKNELLFQPLRIHKSSTMKSTLFILFLSLIVQTYLLGKMKTGQVDAKFSMHKIFFE